MDDIDRLNPYLTYREGQHEAIAEIIKAVEEGHKIIEYKGPTGVGKSLCMSVAARVLEQRGVCANAIYTTPQKTLVAQIANDQKLRIPALLGRENYPCEKARNGKASDCPVPSKKRRKTCGDKCPYLVAKDLFMNAPLGVTTLAKILTDPSIRPPELFIIDECQGLEKALIEQSEIAVPNTVDPADLEGSVDKWVKRIEMEIMKAETAQEIAFEKIWNGGIFNMVDDVDTQQLAVRMGKEITKFERICAKAKSILHIVRSYDPSEYMITSKQIFKLIAGRRPFAEMTYDVDHIIMASATPFVALLADEFQTIASPNPIPKEKRMVYYLPCGKMSMAHREKTIDVMAAKIHEIHEAELKLNGPLISLVHCHSYPLAEALGNAVSDLGTHCMWLDRKYREESIEAWKRRDDAVLFSVACEEGLDLPGKKARLNFISKAPFGFRGDEWFLAREKADEGLPNHKRHDICQTALLIEQAAGRMSRGPDEYGSTTFILDSSFKWFYSQNANVFESWFRDALLQRSN
jgi:Rad3-related DNA helicase